jgi:hypothetical protein
MAVDLHANGVLWGRGRAAEGGVAGLDAGEPHDIIADLVNGAGAKDNLDTV